MPERKQINPKEFITNSSLPTLSIDGMSIATSKDNNHFIQFLTSTPLGILEQVRIVVDQKSMKGFIDSLTEHTGYYPTKAKKQK
jgi:hypothetical protein